MQGPWAASWGHVWRACASLAVFLLGLLLLLQSPSQAEEGTEGQMAWGPLLPFQQVAWEQSR